MNRLVFVLTLLGAGVAAAQTPVATTDPSVSPYTPPPEEKKEKDPKFGDFNAGGQARFPNGPDEMGKFASFNWVAFDVKGRFYLLKTVTINANMPLALKKPDTVMIPGGMGAMVDPSLFGGFTLNLDARLPIKKGSFPMMKFDTDIGLIATFGYMREGAMLLSEKDYPLFTGDMKPGGALGLVTKLKMSSVLDFSLLPVWVHQSGTASSHSGVQVPLALGIGLGSLLKLNLELGIYTGDDYGLRAKNGGRLATGASIDVKLSHLLLHLGAGAASLITDSDPMSKALYPSIGDSFYVDVNAKYAK